MNIALILTNAVVVWRVRRVNRKGVVDVGVTRQAVGLLQKVVEVRHNKTRRHRNVLIVGVVKLRHRTGIDHSRQPAKTPHSVEIGGRGVCLECSSWLQGVPARISAFKGLNHRVFGLARQFQVLKPAL